MLNSWTGRQNHLTITGSATTRPIAVSDGVNYYVAYTTDSTIAGTYTAGSFLDGELVTQAVTGAQGAANGAQAAGASLRIRYGLNGKVANGSDIWLGDTSGATFTPSAFPSTQTPTNKMAISNSLTWDKQGRSWFMLVTRDVQNTSTQNILTGTGDTDDEYFQNGQIQSHWNGANVNNTTSYAAGNLAILYSVANGSTNLISGLSSEKTTFVSNLNSAGNVSGGALGADGSGGSPLSGCCIRAIIFYGRTLNSTDTNTVMDWLTSTYLATSRLNTFFHVMVGDSITEGTQSSIVPLFAWPPQMARDCSYQPKISNRGLGGAAIDPGVGNYIGTTLTTSDLANNAGFATRVVMLLIGTNDISIGGRTSVQIIADLTSWINTVRAADPGCKIIGLTIINKINFTAPQSATQAAVNTWILTGGAYDFTVDIQSDARLQNPADLTYFSYDGIHPNDNGYAVIAALVRAVLLTHSLCP